MFAFTDPLPPRCSSSYNWNERVCISNGNKTRNTVDLWAPKEAVKWFARDWSLLLQPVNLGLRRTTHIFRKKFGTHFNVVLFIDLLSIVLCELDESLWLLCFYITTKLVFFFSFSPTHKPFIVSSSDINRPQCSSIFPWVDYCINSFIIIAVKNYYSAFSLHKTSHYNKHPILSHTNQVKESGWWW